MESVRGKTSIGLALGSGGVKGLAHIGVIKTLEKHGIQINFIAGSSIGALVGAHYASYKDSEKLENAAVNFDKSQAFFLLDPTLHGGIIKGKKVENLVALMLERNNFENLTIPFAAVATDFVTAQPVVIRRGDLAEAVRASISVPSFFQPVSIEEKLLADGGLSNPIPVDVVREMGAGIVIAVNLDNIYPDKPENIDAITSFSRLPIQSINILRYHLAQYAAKTADLVIEPRVYLNGIIGWNDFFNTNRVKEIIKKGETAAEETLPKLQELIALGNK